MQQNTPVSTVKHTYENEIVLVKYGKGKLEKKMVKVRDNFSLQGQILN